MGVLCVGLCFGYWVGVCLGVMVDCDFVINSFFVIVIVMLYINCGDIKIVLFGNYVFKIVVNFVGFV